MLGEEVDKGPGEVSEEVRDPDEDLLDETVRHVRPDTGGLRKRRTDVHGVPDFRASA